MKVNKKNYKFLLLIKPLKKRHNESRIRSIFSLGSASFFSMFLFTLLSFDVQAQWVADTIGTALSSSGVLIGTVKVTSTAGSVGGDNNYQGLIVEDSNFDNQVRIDQAFESIHPANLFKATAGVPFTITLEVSHKFVPDAAGVPSIAQVFIDYFAGDAWGGPGDWYNGSIRALRGKEGQAELYDDDVMLNKDSQYILGPYIYPFYDRASTFSREFTFPEGTERGWIVMGFAEKSYTIYNQGRHTNLIILPFVVEGPKTDLTDKDNGVPILGTFKEPAIPQLILHNPPGDLSTVTLSNTFETCRSISQSLTSDQAAAGRLDVTLGIAGSLGMFVTTEFEFSATISASAGGGSSDMTSNGVSNCITVESTLGTAAGSAPANEGSLYLGYSSDIAYGQYDVVTIEDDLTISTETLIMFAMVPGSAAPFYYSKNDILDEMQSLQVIIDDSTTLDKVRREAESQRDIWQKVLDDDNANIADAAITTDPSEIIQNEFTFTGQSGPKDYTSTVSTTRNNEIEVSHFIEVGLGTSFVLNVGGSGVSGGVEFKTKKTLGASVSNSSGGSTTLSYNLQDDDGGDRFKVKVVKDPTYGTPIFVLNPNPILTATSAPYEGGYQRDQPRFEIVDTASNNTTMSGINTTMSGNSTTISNVGLGSSGSFLVEVCNDNDQETRDYDFGFVGQSVLSDLQITSAGSEGNQLPSLPITRFLTITDIPAGGCKASYFDINMSRRNKGSEMEYSDIEFQLFAEDEPSINSSVFASINWAGPPPPTGVSVSSEAVCSDFSVLLTATCPVTTTATWFDVKEGGFPLAQGGSVMLTPASTTTYYIGCVTPDYDRDRIGPYLVTVVEPEWDLDLESNVDTDITRISMNTITTSQWILAPANVRYKAGTAITLAPGFEVQPGSTFEARVGGCFWD